MKPGVLGTINIRGGGGGGGGGRDQNFTKQVKFLHIHQLTYTKADVPLNI